jgi:branched-chain amino acid transport system substrate-binding protein
VRRVAAALLAALVLTAGCGESERGDARDELLTIYVSVPMQGDRAAAGRAVADGARLAFEETPQRTVGLRVVYLDDTEDGRWSLVKTAANARRATEDSSAIGYIGDLDSGATRASLPITNKAEIVQISPGSTAVDLTRLSAAGTADPEDLRPGDRETFARVVPDDEVQAAAAAVWAKRMGAERVAVGGAVEPFGQVMSEAFLQEAARLGLGTGEGTGADLLYYAGEPDPELFAAATRGVSTRPVIGSDALINPAFLRSTAASAERLYVTSRFQAPSLLPPAGQRFLRAFRERFGRPANPAAAYGYEAMALLLDAIRRAGSDADDRGAVADQVLSTQDRPSVLGTYSIDGNGDTTLATVSGYQISDGLPVFPVELQAGR